MIRHKIVARNQEELDKFGDNIHYGLTMGMIVNPQELVGVTSGGTVFNLEEAVYEYNSKYPFLDEPIQLIKI